jgi:hypothetical protein
MPVNGVDVGVAKGAVSTKGISLGLGVGLGIYGPILLITALVASPCLILLKEVQRMREQIEEMEEHLAKIAANPPATQPAMNLDPRRRQTMYVPGGSQAPGVKLVGDAKPKKRSNYNELRHKNKQKKVNF